MLDHSISQELHIPIHARRTDDLILLLRKRRDELVGKGGVQGESTLQHLEDNSRRGVFCVELFRKETCGEKLSMQYQIAMVLPRGAS